MALLLIHILCSSLQRALSHLSLLCLHQSFPGDGSQQCPLLRCSRPYRLATVSKLSHWSSCSASNISHGPHRKHRPYVFVQLLLSGMRRITIPLLLFAGRCLATTCVQSPISRSPPSNGFTCHSIIWVVRSRSVSLVTHGAPTVMTNAFRMLIGNPERKTLPGRLKHRVLLHWVYLLDG
jgi:hypothetical protein